MRVPVASTKKPSTSKIKARNPTMFTNIFTNINPKLLRKKAEAESAARFLSSTCTLAHVNKKPGGSQAFLNTS